MSESSYDQTLPGRLKRLGRRIFEQRWLNLGLRAKMGLLVEVGLIGLIGIFLFLAVSTARESTMRILNNRVMLARLSAGAIDAKMNHVISVMEIMSRREIWFDPGATDEERSLAVEDAFEQVADITRGVYWLNSTGEEQYAASKEHLALDWPVLQGKAVASSQVVFELSTSDPWAVILIPLIADGEVQGWLSAILNFDSAELSPFQNTSELGSTGAVDLVNAEGRVLASSNPGLPMQEETLDRVRELFVGDKPGVETCLGCGGQDSSESSDEVIAFAPLSEASWGIVVRQLASEAMAPVNRLLLQTLVLSLVSVLGALGLVWVTTNSVIRPVQKLNDAVNRMAIGDLDTPMEQLFSEWIPIRRLRQDEIGALARNFESMRRQLKQSIDETQALNRELDARVQERTAALSYRNQQLSILNAVALTVNQSLQLEDILDHTLEAVLRLIEVDMGAVFLFEELQGSLHLMAYRGMSPEAAMVASNMGLMDSSCGGVVEHGRVVIVPEISRFKGVRARSLQREGVNTLVHIPLTAKGCVLGSLCVGTRQEREFEVDEQEMLQAIGSQIAVAVENARLYAEVQHKERMRGELFRKAINAQEDERKRIARELHDETSQSLTALLYTAEEAGQMKTILAARKRIDVMRDLIQRTLDGIQKLTFDLRPSILDHLGLIPAIHRLAKLRLEAKGVRVSLDADGMAERLPPELETALFRVLQEAINNIARHSAARNVSVNFRFYGSCVSVQVSDDGVGFDTSDLEIKPDSPRGLGLLGMRERLELLGGELHILSTVGSGTMVEISVPYSNG